MSLFGRSPAYAAKTPGDFMENILLIGKDPRLGYLKMLLDADGFPTNHISESPTDAETAAPRVKEEDISLRRAAAHAGSIIGPTPFSRLGEIVEPARLLPLLRPGQKLFGLRKRTSKKLFNT